jgi:hypothetical protein
MNVDRCGKDRYIAPDDDALRSRKKKLRRGPDISESPCKAQAAANPAAFQALTWNYAASKYTIFKFAVAKTVVFLRVRRRAPPGGFYPDRA